MQCFLQNETRLWHRSFERIHEQNNTVCHFQYTFNFTTEVGVTRRINYVNLRVFVCNRNVFRQNGDAAFALQVIIVHNKITIVLILAQNAGCVNNFINQGRFAVVNVRNDCDISDVLHIRF